MRAACRSGLLFLALLACGCAWVAGPGQESGRTSGVQLPLSGTDFCSSVPDICARACAEHDLDYRWPIDADADGDRDEDDRRLIDWKLCDTDVYGDGACPPIYCIGVRAFGYSAFQWRSE